MIRLSPLQLLGTIGLLLALAFAGWMVHSYGAGKFAAGQADVQAQWDKQKRADADAAAKLQAEANRVSTKIVTQYVDRVRVVREKSNAIVRQVPVFVPPGLPDLPGGFRLLHDAAAANEPLPSGASVFDAAPVPAQTVAATVADNYGTDHETAERLISLQDLVYAQCMKNPPPEGCTAPYD
jgi:hypothetical protein